MVCFLSAWPSPSETASVSCQFRSRRFEAAVRLKTVCAFGLRLKCSMRVGWTASDAQVRRSPSDSNEVTQQPQITKEEPQDLCSTARDTDENKDNGEIPTRQQMAEAVTDNVEFETETTSDENARMEAIEEEREADDEQQTPPSQRLQQHETENGDDDEGGTTSLPHWLRANFPDVTSEHEFQQQRHSQSVTTSDSLKQHQQHNEELLYDQSETQLATELLCDECCARQAVFCCIQCDQRLCFKCTDAIHIVSFELRARVLCGTLC